ncbi:MAG: 2-oxo acid dehydrogenase subunit E2 [Clostridia bacterium]|nr:2-oxo acid dehydrogenase subunit E2 [Clostridia bacterium]
MSQTPKRRFGDRKDGRRLRHTQSVFAVMPHIMKKRSDSQVFFDDYIEIDELEQYVRRMRKEHDMPAFSLYHMFVTACMRMFVLRPRLNRFVMNGKIYARNTLSTSMTVKRELHQNGLEATIKPQFEKTDTVFDVYRRINEAMEKEVKDAEGENATDVAANILNRCPAWIVRAFVNFIIFCDNRGWLNDFINKISPFHTSFYLTDVGSIGIEPIYHHIYDFGTTSVFMAIGKKQRIPVADLDGNITVKKIIRIRLVLDERICDGHYYAESFRMFRRLLKKPEVLEVPPTEFPEDTWI